jgi:hypothetical protein
MKQELQLQLLQRKTATDAKRQLPYGRTATDAKLFGWKVADVGEPVRVDTTSA